MAQNSSRTPLLEPGSAAGQAEEGINDENGGGGGMVVEGKKQILFALPLILTNVAYYAIPLASVMFAGHLGDLELASSNLANSWSTVTGLSFMIMTQNFSGALHLEPEFAAGQAEEGINDENGGGGMVVEGKKQILFALPLILTNVAYYAIPLASVMFAGHLGDLELASSNLANSWSTITGLSFVVGLSGAVETLCGQGYGAKLYRLLGIYLQASCIISIIFSLLISVVWWFTEPILIFLHQDPNISKLAAQYIKYLIPGLFAYGLMNCILRFLQTQSIVIPILVCSLLPLTVHIGLAYLLVHCTSLGFLGAPLAVSISFCISLFLLALYVLYAKKFKETWQGFSLESFNHVLTNLKLAVPSAAMVVLEFCAFELLVILAGLLPNSEITTSLIAMCVNTEAIAFNIAYGLSAAASTRVSNELGAGNPDRAKRSMAVTLKLSIILALAVDLALGFGHNIWAGLFSGSSVIIKQYASMTPLLLISIVLDSIQGVVSGAARGCGWQHWAVCINLTMFYLIGMPTAVVLAFKLKLYVKGLWIGLICGLFCQAGSLLLLMYLKKWKRVDLQGNGADAEIK